MTQLNTLVTLAEARGITHDAKNRTLTSPNGELLLLDEIPDETVDFLIEVLQAQD